MSGFGLTANHAGQLASGSDYGRFADTETDERLEPPERAPSVSSSRSPSELFSSAFRGIKKIAPSREDFSRLAHQPSQLGLRRPSEPFINAIEKPLVSATLPKKSPSYSHLQHARSLSLQSSLEKPLPEPPPQLSPDGPLTPVAEQPQQLNSLGTILDSENEDGEMDGRTNTMDSTTSSIDVGLYMGQGLGPPNAGPSAAGPSAGPPPGREISMSSSQSSLGGQSISGEREERSDSMTPKSTGPLSAGPSPGASQTRPPAAGAAASGAGNTSSASSTHLSGLMCNVHRTTGREPHPLVGATTTILGDKLYVFGGRILSRNRPAPLTADLYELDLIRRHWTKLETTGDVPPPRYFHSMCALGDTKMVCYGGMSPTTPMQTSPGLSQEQQAEVTVVSDIYVYDVPSKKWTYVPTQDAPQGRYAHCACILSSSANFSSATAPLSALQHNPSFGNPNEGRIGINIDGTGGAEMVIVGGQDGANHYIEQISVFNLRSLKWTTTEPLGKSCGAYRSVVAPLPPSAAARLGKAGANGVSRHEGGGGISQEAREPGSSMLIYSNYNFLDVKLELQIRSPDGTLAERTMDGSYNPPGLRFPNGGVIDTHFVVSGTYLTSSKQEYALWALDLRTLTWSRIDAGGTVFSQGSWNRGVLWNRRNTFVILGNRKRRLVEDYNHRRINFSNVCMVELEAFGFYDNPRKSAPMSGFISASSPYSGPGLSLARKAGSTAGGRFLSRAAEELGEKVLSMRELADMDILCVGGERIPVSSRIVARRWGPYFVQLLREGTATQDGSDAMTLRSGSISGASGGNFRTSSMTITPSGSRGTMDSAVGGSMAGKSSFSNVSGSISGTTLVSATEGGGNINNAPTPRTLPPHSRPRCLYLPHTLLTVKALVHYLYTSSLPQPPSQLCTPQILCSLLQLARPYRIDGLLEAVVERLHNLLDSRNAAAVFNATAMAAGGGRGIDGSLNPNFFAVPVGGLSGGDVSDPVDFALADEGNTLGHESATIVGMGLNGSGSSHPGGPSGGGPLRINTSAAAQAARPTIDELSAGASVSGSEWGGSEVGDGGAHEIWAGELSSVIGLQKRGLRGLMEGRRMRERTGTNAVAGASGSVGGGGGGGPSGAGGGGGGGGSSSYGGGAAAQGAGYQGRSVGLGIANS